MNTTHLIIVRGGGDLATGTIHKLHRCGFPVLILETDAPSAIRRNVSFCEAVYTGAQTVEGVTCTRTNSIGEALSLLRDHALPLLVDPEGTCIAQLRPLAVIDAILAKRNLGTHRAMAPITVALGPGFIAGEDVHAVVETKRGHHLGRVIYSGSASENTGVPGVIAGYGKERVLHSPAEGVLRNVRAITDTVKKGEVIAVVKGEQGETPVYASLDGLLRGLIRDGYPVTKGFKIADIDPRISEYDNCFTISDKARCIAGGVLEAILHLQSARA
ncbi:MAG: EF2563 family selenium-dependent molybdenum hydroxylase system protein [Clostridia bacterium]|nr:EF2563 family selenium-dependent molybdenum hydroxylase system protein [Clostridia bacterium]